MPNLVMVQCQSCGRNTVRKEYCKVFETVLDICATCESIKESRLDLIMYR
jgi:hypothetical protein